MEYNIKLEKELIKLGFKKKWLVDKSGYWMEKGFKYKDLRMKFYIETDRKLFTLGCKTGSLEMSRITFRDYYDDVAKYKCDLRTIKKVINNYK